MQNKSVSKVFYGALMAALLGTSPAHATGFPTFDIAEVFNTIQSVISQAQAQISTVQETLSIANIQQAIGDKLGGLRKFQRLEKIKEEFEAKQEKIQKRLQRLEKLKKEYEQRVKDTVADVKDKYDDAKNFVDGVKDQVDNTKSQIENTVQGVKDQVDNTKSQIENTVQGVKDQVNNTVNNVKNEVDNAKNQVNNITNQVESTVEGIKDAVDGNKSAQGSSSDGVKDDFSVDSAADLWGDGAQQSAPAALEKQNIKPTQEKGNMTQEKAEDFPQAFKTSYENYTPMGYADMGVKTGTDKEGNYFFPDELAWWCNINYDDKIDEEKALECFHKICDDLNAKDATEAKKNKDRFGILLGQSLAHNFAAAVSIKDKAASSKVVDDVHDTLGKSGDDLRTQVSGNGEVTDAQLLMTKDTLLIEAGKQEVTIIEAIETYCRYYEEVKDQ